MVVLVGGFDGTHIFGTASRTYFDPEARSADTGSVVRVLAFFFALGPVIVWRGWKHRLAIVVGIWAYYPRYPAALRIHGAVQGKNRT